MGVRGVLPQPDNIRQLRGNPSRSHPAPTVKAVAAIPNPPGWLSKEGKAEWRRITPELHRLQLLARIDRAILTAYCSTWAFYTDAVRAVQEQGILVKARGSDDKVRGAQTRNPALQAMRDMTGKLVDLSRELGLTPNARLRMTAPKLIDDSGAGLD